MAGLGKGGRERQEQIRRSFSAPTVTQTDPAKIVFFDREVYGLKQSVFDCERIIATVTREQCAASHLRNNIGSACYKCPIGSHFSGGAPVAENMHTAVNDSLGLACIRCERTGLTATRVIGRFRLVKQHTICISCANREYECVKGANSKGAAPQKWAHLRQATVTIEDAAGEWQTLDLGLRSGRAECERYVERIHPGSVIVEVFIGGVSIPVGAVDPRPEYWPAVSRTTNAPIAASKPRKKRTRAVAPDHQAAAKAVDWDDWDTPLYAKPVASDESDADGNGTARRAGWLPPMSEEDDAAYRESFDETAEPSAPVAEAVEHVETAPVALGNTYNGMRPDQFAAHFMHSQRDDAPKGITEADLVLATGCSLTCEYAPVQADDEPTDTSAPDEAPQPVIEPARKPQKPLTGKQLRKLEKAQRRAERQAPAPAPERPTIGKSPRAIAVTARALVQVAFELNGFTA